MAKNTVTAQAARGKRHMTKPPKSAAARSSASFGTRDVSKPKTPALGPLKGPKKSTGHR